MLKQIHHKKNELFEVESFKDEECTEAFDFTNAENLYIKLKNGDITPLYILKDKYYWRNVYTPYMPHKFSCEPCDNITTLDDITPNLSKYIPEDNAVLFLSEEDRGKYIKNVFTKTNSSYMVASFDNYIICSYDKQFPKNHKNATIFLPHGTQSELKKANEVEKELKEKYCVEDVNLFVLHNFHHNCITYNDNTMYFNGIKTNVFWNKIITTNSTGILKPEDSNERLQVIDCKEFFEEYLNKNNLI
jgi:hypothetical protein